MSFERQDEFLLRAGLLDQLERLTTAAQSEADALVLRSSVRELILPGGMSAQESFDPKIYSPVEYRGPLGSVETKIPGERFCELFRNTAQIADKKVTEKK